ncbi:MAG: universal stress protein [Terriglobales bacterium]
MADKQPSPADTTLDAATPISIERIMLATDFDPVSEAALHYSLSIARRYGAKVYLLHVVGSEPFQFLAGDAQQRALEDAWRNAQRHMTDLLIAGHLEGVDHQVLVEQGDVWDVLSRKITDLNINLLVIGTHARGRVGKLLLGSVAETIFRQAPCPVLMVGPHAGQVSERTPQQPILFCTGFSAHSLKAGGYALSLAQHQAAQLVLMHVSKETPPSEAERLQIVEQAKRRLASLIPAGTQMAEPPETIVEFGTAGDRILEVAQKIKPGLIVLGVRQPVGFARRLKWATAYEVVANAPCPVLTVRMAEPE